MKLLLRRTKKQRRGTASVEMAFLAPVFLTLVVGLAEASRIYDVQNQLSSAARDGARLAAMDREGVTPEGVSTNAKIALDIKNMLNAAGLPGDEATVSITQVDSDAVFDLDDPDNDLALFEVSVDLDYSEVNSYYSPVGGVLNLTGKIVLRNARSSLVN